jgi:hypothetical protein
MTQIRFERSAAAAALSVRARRTPVKSGWFKTDGGLALLLRGRIYVFGRREEAIPCRGERSRYRDGMKDEQPTNRELFEVVQHIRESLDVVAVAVGRIELDVRTLKADVAELKADVAVLKADVAGLKSDFARLERRVIRIDDRLAVIENAQPIAMLFDHERRISRLEGISDGARS